MKSLHFFICVFVLLPLALLTAETPITITILETSDLHGNVIPWDYFQQRPYDQGLATVATLVGQEREKDPELLLLDGGDANQGSPLISVYLSQMQNFPNPMTLVMNHMQYDAMTIGNHDFNFGLTVLNQFIAEADFPILSANIQNENGSQHFKPFIIKEVKGFKIGILGLTTNGIPVWEKPQHIKGLKFENPVRTAKTWIPEMKSEGADVILALVHAGTEKSPVNSGNPEAWKTDTATWLDQGYSNIPDENFIMKLAEDVPEIEVIFSGHAHQVIPEMVVSRTLIVQPASRGLGLIKVELTLDCSGTVVDRKSEYLSTRHVPADTTVVRLAEPYHTKTLAYVNQAIGIATGPFPGGMAAREKDGPLADLINAIQIDMAKQSGIEADLSSTAIFNNRGHFDDTVRVADVYAVCPYDNTLFAIEVTGKQLKEALEQSASYWKSPGQPADNARNYNWDLFIGVNYKLDLTRPVGQRVIEMSLNSKAIDPEKEFVMLLNNYRAGGGGGYSMYNRCKKLWESTETMREYIIDYITREKTLNPKDYFVRNWEILNP